MYHWIEDKEFLGKMRRECSDLVNRLVNLINKEGKMLVGMQMVGSGARNLETQNNGFPIDLDYNLNIKRYDELFFKDGKKLKEYVRAKFNKVLSSKKLPDCDDSTSALTTKKMKLPYGNNTEFSIDLTITKEISGRWNKLIHVKIEKEKWEWNPIKDSTKIDGKAKYIKSKGKWGELRECYLKKKNLYLTINDNNHPSYICYIEAINEIYSNLSKR